MITINNLSLQYGDKHLFREVSARINPLERIGLVGVNGAGKSTLLKMIAGQVETDFGVITKSRQATIGYLPQEVSGLEPGRTLYQEAESSFGDTLRMQDELAEINRLLAECDPHSPGIPELLEQQGELQHHLDQADIFTMQSRIEKILFGLGFTNADLERDCHSFSGGWITRLMLAKHLLAQPSYLLLDEPTNHLDIESLTWLEDFLKSYAGSIVLISHDRAFLDNVTNITWELSLGRLNIYKGNYSKYLLEKEVRMEVQRAAYENQQAQLQQTKRFIERFRATSTKASQVQSRVKQMAKVELIELDDSEAQVSFRFPPAAPSGRNALVVEGLAKSFGEKMVFDGLSFEIQRGEKLGVFGVNGAGKSTLVKILAGIHPPDAGAIRFGHNVIPAYFGQHQAQELPLDYTVLGVLLSVNSGMSNTQLRSLLGAFLFRGDDVDKKVRVLSGGEKSRLALARMIASPANLLIMDEPTNHLDMRSQEVLQEAMAQYDGSIIVVSHNRYFVDSFINKILEIKNGRGTIFEGNTAYYLEKIRAQKGQTTGPAKLSSAQSPAQPTTAAPVADPKKAYGKEARQLQAKLREDQNKRFGPLKKAAEREEKLVEELESRKGGLEKKMADPELYQNQDAFNETSRAYSDVERQLKRAYIQWEEAQAKVEALETELALKLAALEGP
jgi:ATP-binding cassette subfamily F protein 3